MGKNNEIANLVADLPEVYQEIYGHPEFSIKSSRSSDGRLTKIESIYDKLKQIKGRDLKVLDLGCAQGFFSFNLAKKGATVHGIDFLDKNLNLCRAIAKENPQFKATFEENRVENVVQLIKKNQYDLVLGLSIFHHVAYEHGKDFVEKLMAILAKNVDVGLFEFALPIEPLYWAKSQPNNPKEFLSNYSFIHELAWHKTHLSEIMRPLYVVSNRYWIFNDQIEEFFDFKSESHSLSKGIFQGTRKYFFSKKYFLKHYRLDNDALKLANLKEYNQEINFSKKYTNLFPYNEIISSGKNENEAWVVSKKIEGKLLSELIENQEKIDAKKILKQILKQLVKLEELGLYHTDLRAWNVIVDKKGNPFLIDFGAIVNHIEDCAWPNDVFYSFIIFAKELILNKIYNPIPNRKFWLNFSELPIFYQNWFNKFLSSSVEEKTFKNLLILFQSSKVDMKNKQLIYDDLISFLSRKIDKQYESSRDVQDEDLILQSDLRKIKDDLLNTKNDLLNTSNNLLNTRNDLLNTRQQLVTLQNSIVIMQNTKLWKLAEKVRGFAKFLLPKNSLQRKFLKKIYHLYLYFFQYLLMLLKVRLKNFIKYFNSDTNRQSKKIVYIGHSYHDKTQSTAFLINYLKEHFEVTVVLDETWQGKAPPNLDFIDDSYLGVVFFQRIYSPEILAKIKNKNLIFCPMYDGSGALPSNYWLQYKDIKFLNFSKTLHKKLINLGLNSLYSQYFPKPNKFYAGNTKQVFFWQRLTYININTIEKLFGNEKELGIHLHKAIDPNHTFIKPTKEQEQKFSISYSTWLKNKKDLNNLIKKAAIYVAPRENEGIGLSFLEAMAMGKVVVAVNHPTMNEYIKHNKTGYLFDLDNIKPINLNNLNLIQKKSYKFISFGYKKWAKNRIKIINFIKK